MQGKPGLADRFFDEAVGLVVPDRTVSVNKPIEAPAAFRRGTGRRHSGSGAPRRTPRSRLPGSGDERRREFINMMATIDRLPAADRVLDYLTTADDFGALAARTLVDAAAKIATGRETYR